MNPPPSATDSGIDVRQLPATVFGARDTAWWGTVFFMAIEGTTLFICASSYLYLRHGAAVWPPEHTPLPTRTWPTIALVLMILSNAPLALLRAAARKFDLAATRRWAGVAAVMAVAFLFFRWGDFAALNVRWDTNAYASIAWMTVGFHTLLLIGNAFEVVTFAALLFSDRRTERHFSDAADTADYWHFMIASWIPLYVVVYLVPFFGK